MTEKAIISNRIYFKYRDKEHLKQLIDVLTYKIEKKHGGGGGRGAKFKSSTVEVIKNYKILPRDIISVPQGRTDLVPEGLELVDKRVLNPVPFPDPKFALRESQQVVYDEINDTCFINALVGWGKCFAL